MYNYLQIKPQLFLEENQALFLRVRDHCEYLLDVSGAFTVGGAMQELIGDSWLILACIDRLVELGELTELTPPETVGQDRVFVRADKPTRVAR